MTRELEIAPPRRFSLMFVYVVATIFTIVIVSFHIGSTGALSAEKAWTQAQAMLLMFGLVALAFGLILFALRRHALILTDSELIVRTGFYGRTIPRANLRLESAAQFSLGERPELLPRWRTNGIALPGYRAGWFRLRNGEKALMHLTDPSQVTYLQTTLGYSLVISTSALLPALGASTAIVTPEPAAVQ